jgi:predicted O-methyltransferase YrrM
VRGHPLEWTGKKHLRIGETEFLLTFDAAERQDLESRADRFILAKTKNMVERHIAHAPETVDNVVDLGILKGGSVALIAELFAPAHLVALDIETRRVGALDTFVAKWSLGEVVHLHYGVDQGDQRRLTAILDQAFGSEPIDFVIDDCSHLYGPTKASLNVLLPRLRPGGVYLIEDWRYWPNPDERPLFALIQELIAVAAAGRGVIRELHIQGATVYLTRGDEVITDPDFTIDRATA